MLLSMHSSWGISLHYAAVGQDNYHNVLHHAVMYNLRAKLMVR